MGVRKTEMAKKLKEQKKVTAIAKLNNVPTSPRKMRLVADTVRGVEVNRALDLLHFSKREASICLEKLLRSAIANWEAKNQDKVKELENGNVIVKTFSKLNPVHTPAVLVKNHGPFAWGKDAAEAVYHAKVLEEVAKMNYIAETLYGNRKLQQCVTLSGGPSINKALIEKHFSRKHGPNAYYGQKKK